MISKLGLVFAAACVAVMMGAAAEAQTEVRDSNPIQTLVENEGTASAAAETANVDATSAQEQAEKSPAIEPAKTTPPPIPPMFLKMGALSAKYDKFHPWDWFSVPFPSIGDTMIGDSYKIRETLAKYNMSFLIMPSGGWTEKVKKGPVGGYYSDGFKAQVFSGEKPTPGGGVTAYFTWSSFKTGTQFNFAINEEWCRMPAMITTGDDVPRIAAAYINQYFWHKKAIIDIGYVASGYNTIGLYVDGNMAASMLGVAAILPTEAGQNSPEQLTPNFNIHVDWTKHFYTVTGDQRSLSPYSALKWHSLLYLPFAGKAAGHFMEQEVGYKRNSAPGVHSLWVRIDGFYNTTHYFDYRKSLQPNTFTTNADGTPSTATTAYGYFSYSLDGLGDLGYNFIHRGRLPKEWRTTNNWCYSNGWDYQVTQPDPMLPFRGFYVGNTDQYTPPQQNMFTAYYEGRFYYVGPFKRRVMDLASFVVSNEEFSRIYLKYGYGAAVYGKPTLTDTYTGQTNLAASYTAHLQPGVWGNLGVQYSEHPFLFPRWPSVVNLNAGLTMFW